MFSIFGFDDFYGDQYSSYGPDRSGWADKSQAALRRENQAKQLFNDFLKTVDKETSSFPYSKEVIPPQVHLTSACYTSFRKYVTSKGCKCVRREASWDEKMALSKSDQRNCKMYFVKITVPTSPAQLMQKKAEQERKAQEQKAKKQAAEEKKRKLEQELVEKTKQEYALAVAHVEKCGTSAATSSVADATIMDKENVANNKQEQEGSPSKRLKTTPATTTATTTTTTTTLVITVPQARILAHHASELAMEKRKVRRSVLQKKQDELRKVQEEIAHKYAQLEQQELATTQAHFDWIQKAILEAPNNNNNKAPTTADAAANKPTSVVAAAAAAATAVAVAN